MIFYLKKATKYGLSIVILSTFFVFFAKAQTTKPSSPPYDFHFFKKGLVAQNKGDYKDAIMYFTFFIDNCTKNKLPPYPKAYYWRANAQKYIKAYKLAIVDFSYLHTITEPDADAALQTAKCYNGLDDPKNALIWLNKAYERAPRSAIIQNELGMTYGALNNNLEALNHFRTAFGLDTTFALAYNNAGAAMYFKQDIELPSAIDVTQARNYFAQAIQKDSTMELAWRNKGSAEFFLGNYATAKNDLLHAEKLAPREAQTKIYLGVVAMAQTDFAFAQSKLEAAAQLKPSAETAWEELGNLALAQQQYATAIAHFLKAEAAASPKANGYKGLMHYHIATVYATRNDAAQNDATNTLKELKTAKKLGAFADRFVYQVFMKNEVFKSFRNEKSFSKFSDSLYKLNKSNKFLTQFRWFKMRQGVF
jgi:tetratricopeptide (TPR) repeat protein